VAGTESTCFVTEASRGAMIQLSVTRQLPSYTGRLSWALQAACCLLSLFPQSTKVPRS
jgi:hypothetical protein